MCKNSTVQEVFDILDDEQKKLVYALVGHVTKTRRMPKLLIDYETGNVYGDFGSDPSRNLFDTFTDIQKECADAIVRDMYKRINIAFMMGED